jgi:hypothetical protein
MSKHKREIVGIGLDSDGHKRIATGPNFKLAGGTQDTHEETTEKPSELKRSSSEEGRPSTKLSPASSMTSPSRPACAGAKSPASSPESEV